MNRDIDELTVQNLREKARLLRRHIIEMLGKAGSGHTGGSLSAAEIMAVLYFWELNIDPANPAWEQRDRFVLSKGHAAPVLYATLAERGYFDREWLQSLRRLGSPLQGHPDMRKVPGVEASTGSLGQGFSMAVGMALAGKLDRASYRVYALLGDGELQEGIIWEAAMAAAHYKLGNLVAIIDNNNLQIDGPVSDVLSPLPLADKFQAFNWQVIEIDGHDVPAIMSALSKARYSAEQPVAIIAHTVKGRGVSFCENQVDWHGKTPDANQVATALSELA